MQVRAAGDSLPRIQVHGVALRFHRKAAGVRQDDLAATCGLSKSFVCHLEAGRRVGVRREIFDALAAAIGCDPRLITTEPQSVAYVTIPRQASRLPSRQASRKVSPVRPSTAAA